MTNAADYTALAAYYDLADEAAALLRGQGNRELPGIKEEVCQNGPVKAHTVTIYNQTGERLLRRSRGRYITLSLPDLDDGETMEQVAQITAGYLASLLPPLGKGGLMLVGLGNDSAVADSLGPKVVDKTYATRHLQPSPEDFGMLCALAPGVLGATGIETAEILKGAAEYVRPDAILVVDSLAAASVSRVGVTVQMSESGICPGSGVGNARQAITAQTMGVPVVAVGVPTVVNAYSIIRETAESLGRYWQRQGKSYPAGSGEAVAFAAGELLQAFSGVLMVTPKDVDDLIAKVAEVLAAAVALVIHPAALRQGYHSFIK
ncbi:MAG: GPR endopeptidase [Firmicutes bacterium]|nr:GPR endopeptidase [Bacillota bacterium]